MPLTATACAWAVRKWNEVRLRWAVGLAACVGGVLPGQLARCSGFAP